MPKIILEPKPVTNPPTGSAESFITSPRVDAYLSYGPRTWDDFVKGMRHQAMCWGLESSKRGRALGAYRYPAIGFFGDRKFALFVPKGNPQVALTDELSLVEVAWPSEWNVT